MTKVGKQPTTRNQNKQKLNRKALIVFLPIVLLPIFILGFLLQTLPLRTAAEVSLVVGGTALIAGCLAALIFSAFIKKQVTRPLLTITSFLEKMSDGKKGEDLNIHRNDEIGALVDEIHQASENYSRSKFSLETETITLSKQINACAAIARAAIETSNLDGLLHQVVNALTEQFEHPFAAIYLRGQAGKTLNLCAYAGIVNPAEDLSEYSLMTDHESIVGWAAKNNRLRIAPQVSEDQFYKPFPGLSQIRSELAFPIVIDSDVFGVLDLQDTEKDAFSWDEITILQTLVDQIAGAIHNYWLIENTRFDPKISAYLFNASHQIMSAGSQEPVYQVLARTLARFPFLSAFYLAGANSFQRKFSTNPQRDLLEKEPPASLAMEPGGIHPLIPDRYPLTISHSAPQVQVLPELLVQFSEEFGYKNLILYPLFLEERLFGLLFLGTTGDEPVHPNLLTAVTKLFEITKSSLENQVGLQVLRNQLDEQRALNQISQSISTETDLNHLFEMIHEQVINVMGDVNFLIALYSEDENTIEIPYMDDGEKIVSVPPFPMGQGLTSIIVRTRQPLMIVEDTENRSRALGAIITDDKPAKSWLGVPILVGEALVGAIIVQDLEQENRFDKEDMHLLMGLASQIGIAVRNTRLIEMTEKRAARDRTLVRMSNRIWNAIDIEEILAITAEELGKTLDARRTTVEISLDPDILDKHDRREHQVEGFSG